MLVEQVKKLKPIDRLLYWIFERESIRLRKEDGASKPWTNDAILQGYRFCNVRRMDDFVSKWLLTNWYGPNAGSPNMLVACAVARHFNNPDSLLYVTKFVFDWQPERIKQKMRALKFEGNTIFNGAYMVRGIGTADKTEMVVDKVCQPLVDNPPTIRNYSMEETWSALLPYWGFSSFMAGQVVADLRHAMDGSWDDRFQWAPIGPGSKRGMNRLLSRPINQPMKQAEFTKALQELIVELRSLPRSVYSRLEAIDFQNCLCEFDKYTRCLLGEGRPKQLYNGAA